MKKKKEILDFGNNPEFNVTLTRICRRIFLNNSDPPESILITSSLSGEGKTTVAINLAKCIAAESNRKTLLIEGNLKNRKIQHYFDLPDSYGITDFMLKNTSLHTTIQNSSVLNLYIMGAGSDGSQFLPPAKIANLKSLLEQSKKEYDFIIFDAPPVLETPETSILSKQFDGTLLIIQANRTVRFDVERTKQEIIESGGKILGIILNRKREYIPIKISRKYYGNNV
jgi:capsular exopolysaccharide synthesis family protein